MTKTLLKIILIILGVIIFFIGGTLILKDTCNMSSFSHAFKGFCLGFLIASPILSFIIGLIIVGIIDLFTFNIVYMVYIWSKNVSYIRNKFLNLETKF